MNPKILAGIAATTLVLVIGCTTGLGLAGGSLAAATCAGLGPLVAGAQPTTGTFPGGVTVAAVGTSTTPSQPPVGSWDSTQVTNAATIVSVGWQLFVPPQGWVIAVATAIQESRLRNLPDGDRDSLGLFQQRPSQGWADTPAGPGDHRTPAQRLLDPTYAAGRFYTALAAVPGWQDLPLTVAAQAVQRSGFPDAYAQWESEARTLVETVTGFTPAALVAGRTAQQAGLCSAFGGDGQPPAIAAALPAGFTLAPGTPPAARTAIRWALAQLGTPYSYGGDCTDPHGPDPAHRCDCSSLTQQAWRAAGITLPRTAAEQSRSGTPVPSLALLRPGDLVALPGANGTAIAPGHIGMFIGSGLIVHAPRTGDRVKLVPLQRWAPQITHLRRVN